MLSIRFTKANPDDRAGPIGPVVTGFELSDPTHALWQIDSAPLAPNCAFCPAVIFGPGTNQYEPVSAVPGGRR